MDSKKLLPLSIVILAVSVVFASLWTGHSLNQVNKLQTTDSTSFEQVTFTLSQVAEYLNMTEEDIQGIIKTESDVLKKSGVFIGKRFPYLKVNNKYYFYIDEIDEWLKEVTSSHREYDTAKGYIF